MDEGRDVVFDSPFSRIYKTCREWLGWTGNRNFFQRMVLVQLLERRTIQEGGRDGFGSFEKPYWMCSRGELLGSVRIMPECPF